MQISVIIPTYNRDKYLKKTLESVLNQTMPVLEILVCDDGSTDRSREIVDDFKNEKIKWIDCGKNGRPAIPRNIGIRTAVGDWLAFLDSDDTWLPNKLELQVAVAREKGFKAICCNALRIKPNDNTVPEPYLPATSGKIEFQKLVYNNLVICSSTLIRKDLFELENDFPAGRIIKVNEDYSLWLKIASKTDWYYMGQTLMCYLDNPSESIRNSAKSDFRNKIITYLGYLRWNKLRFLNKFSFVFIYIFKFTLITGLIAFFKHKKH